MVDRAEPDVFDVVDGFLEQNGNVAVVEGVDDPAPLALADDEAEVAEDPELVGDGGLLHRHSCSQLVHRAGRLAEPCEDADPAGCRERVHRLSDLASGGGVDRGGLRMSALDTVSHVPSVYERVFMSSCHGRCMVRLAGGEETVRPDDPPSPCPCTVDLACSHCGLAVGVRFRSR